MMKILYVASKVKLHINLFHVPFLERLKQEGHEVHVCASNDYSEKDQCIIPGCDVFYDVPFHRIPFHSTNIKAYLRLKKIINENRYDIIHCHTPIGGALARLAARRARRMGTKVVYTAHGFHFFQGASTASWILFYSAERFLSRFTDVLITINEEDMIIARTFRAHQAVNMRGVGIDIEKFKTGDNSNRNRVRKSIGIPGDGIVMIFAGELSYRKHQDFLINAMKGIGTSVETHLILAGEGNYQKEYSELAAELGLLDTVHFLGFRDDVHDLMDASDICVSSSRQEGLPVNIMEAMASGLPVVCFDIRGNRDLIEEGKGGYLVPYDNLSVFCEKLRLLINDADKRRDMGKYNQNNMKPYDRAIIIEEMMELYKKVRI